MPIHRERYRRREGGLDVAGRAWMVIAASGLRALSRKRAFLFLMILAWMPVVVRGVQIWAAANVPGMAEMGMLAVTPRMFRDFLNQQDVMTFFITVYAGSGLIADDIRARALQLYLSRPVTRLQYVAGKAAILIATLAAITWLPALLLLMLVPAFMGSMAFIRDNLTLIPSISAYSIIKIALSTAIILALSSLSNSRWFVAVMYAGLAFFTHAVYGVIANVGDSTMFSWVSIFSNVHQVGDVLFRMTPRYDTPPIVSATVIAVAIAVSAYVLSRRIRAIEVVT